MLIPGFLMRSYFFSRRTASFAALATRNLTTVLAGILMFCCVFGLKPVRAFLSALRAYRIQARDEFSVLLIGTATINHDDLLFARESLVSANGPNDMRCFVQRWNDDAYAHITLKANRLNFSRYHAQGAAATAFAAAIGGVAFSAGTLFQ